MKSAAREGERALPAMPAPYERPPTAAGSVAGVGPATVPTTMP
jgi:hypothetical protein